LAAEEQGHPTLPAARIHGMGRHLGGGDLLPKDSLDLAAKADQIAAELEPKIRKIHQQHPIQAGILSAVCQQLLQFIRLSAKLAPEDFRVEAAPLVAGVSELSTWLVDSKIKPSLPEIQADIDSWVSGYVSAGFKGVSNFTDALRKTWLGKPRGRRVKRRLAAVGALEAKLADPNLTWQELAEKFYPVAKDENIESPAQALRQEVIALRKVLKRHGIPGSAPFERRPRGDKKAKRTPR
jgi:hypothetical protein